MILDLRIKKLSAKSYQPKASEGFSTIELLIYIAVFVFISVGLVDLITVLNTGWNRSRVETEVNQNLRYATNIISSDIKNADSVATPENGASGSTLDINVAGDSHKYFISGITLQKQVNTDTPVDITTDSVKVTELNFSTFVTQAESNASIYATTTQFYIKMEYNSDNQGFQYVQEATTTAALR